MEHIKLSEEEVKCLIDMLESEDSESHVLAHGVINTLDSEVREYILLKVNPKGWVNYWWNTTKTP